MPPSQKPPGIDLIGDPTPVRAELVELFKMYVGNAEAVVTRRHSVNTFFLSVNTLLLSAIALVTEFGKNPQSGAIAIAILALTGVVLATIWRSIIELYGRQRTSMFTVIYALESAIGIRLFQCEWQHLNGTESPGTVRTFTKREARVPVVFICTYVVGAVGALLVAAVVVPA